MNDLRPLLGFHALFALAAVLALGLAPAGWYGVAILGSVVGYHLALLAWAAMRGYREWVALWAFLLPLSLAQVLPDWILAELIGSLRFFDHGIPRVGAVPLYMAGMWMIPLFLIVRLSDTVRPRLVQPLMAVLLALLIFGSSEWYARPLGLWHEVGVSQTWLGIALYVLPAEAVLGLAAWWGYRVSGEMPLPGRVLLALGISVLYTGALVSSYFFIETGARL